MPQTWESLFQELGLYSVINPSSASHSSSIVQCLKCRRLILQSAYSSHVSLCTSYKDYYLKNPVTSSIVKCSNPTSSQPNGSPAIDDYSESNHKSHTPRKSSSLKTHKKSKPKGTTKSKPPPPQPQTVHTVPLFTTPKPLVMNLSTETLSLIHKFESFKNHQPLVQRLETLINPKPLPLKLKRTSSGSNRLKRITIRSSH
ncbi:hypothetical protein GEMRC1_012193 [Eukaryota sp. GEM-RC1]